MSIRCLADCLYREEGMGREVAPTEVKQLKQRRSNIRSRGSTATTKTLGDNDKPSRETIGVRFLTDSFVLESERRFPNASRIYRPSTWP
jgi:hypothetical protein